LFLHPYVEQNATMVDFNSHLEDAKLQMVSAGFSTELWVPEFGWENEGEATEMSPRPPQLLAAIQLFIQLYVHKDSRIWTHLAAEMQAGKTGVMSTLIRLILANAKKLNMRPNRIFVLTGMSDDAWKIQTRERMPRDIRENVQHSKGLSKIALAFQRLRELDGKNNLSNIIVLLDESHIATSQHNQPNLHIWEPLNSLCPIELRQENNVRIVTISATDPCKVLFISGKSQPASVVRLHTNDAYQSIQSLVDRNRIRFAEEFGDVHLPKAIKEIKRSIEIDFKNDTLYHIIRPRPSKEGDSERALRENFPGCSIRLWNASSKSKKKSFDDTSSSSGFHLNDINELLREEPIVTTFVILKNMFYASKTLDDRYVGIMYDRIGGKDDTNLQSLPGRAAGYGKSERTIIYTSKQTINNYLECWRELCSNTKASLQYNIPVSHLNRKMVGIHAKNGMNGKKSAELSVEGGFQTPIGQTNKDVSEKTKSGDEIVIEELFETPKEAKKWSQDNLSCKATEFCLYSQEGGNGNTHIKYRGVLRKITSYLETISSGDLSYGLGSSTNKTGSPRVMPVFVDDKIKFIIIYKKHMRNS
jgi:hypothetical protein